MTPEEIQAEVDRLCSAMLAKGLTKPKVQVDIESGKLNFCLFLNWTVATHKPEHSYGNSKYEFFREGTVAGAVEKASAYIEALPGREETQMRQFLEAVSAAVEVGRQNGIDANLLNPLQLTMQELSANILLDHRSPEEKAVKIFDENGGDMPF